MSDGTFESLNRLEDELVDALACVRQAQQGDRRKLLGLHRRLLGNAKVRPFLYFDLDADLAKEIGNVRIELMAGGE